jgi:hypothetical protein
VPTIDHVSVIDADADAVWQVLRRFGEIPKWFPAGVTHTEIEDDLPDTTVGCVRLMTLSNGNALREKLFGLDDVNRTFSYGFGDDTLPYDDFVMRVEVLPVSGGGRSVLRWTARFDIRAGTDREPAMDAMRGLIFGGDASLHHYMQENAVG